MCQIKTVRKFAKWLTEKPAINLETGLPALLAVTVGEQETVYAIARHPYRGGVWQVWHDAPDGGEPELYDVDTTFGDDPTREWSCTCKDYVYRSGKRPEPGCKHCRFLAAALNKIGVQP